MKQRRATIVFLRMRGGFKEIVPTVRDGWRVFAFTVFCIVIFPFRGSIATPVPSFDCKNATQQFETAICQNFDLARMDDLLAKMYKTVPANNQARNEHRVWNNLRVNCGRSAVCIFEFQRRSYRAMAQWTDDRDKRLFYEIAKKFINTPDEREWAPRLPTAVGSCSRTQIGSIRDRNGDDVESDSEFGVVLTMTNGAILLSDKIYKMIRDSVSGDIAIMCLESISENCPAGDARGRIYSVNNIRIKESGIFSDSEHKCGGQ